MVNGLLISFGELAGSPYCYLGYLVHNFLLLYDFFHMLFPIRTSAMRFVFDDQVILGEIRKRTSRSRKFKEHTKDTKNTKPLLKVRAFYG